MCGIVGILPRTSPVSKEQLGADLLKMRDAISYRGPDDRGEFVTDEVALGHRRLSILDLSHAGHQPMPTAEGKCWLVFNGEIYNYKQLQKKYLQDVELKSKSDTEVLLYLLQRKGLDILPDLRGMFAFAFWDGNKKELLLARDRFGKKPLYYVWQDDLFAFASEPKALLQLEGAAKKIDAGEHARYLLHEYVPSPATIWVGIKQLAMGEAAVVNKKSMDMATWWKPLFIPKKTRSFPEAVKRFDELLGQAVERRMIADVPVGLFLSGGIDSTTILWYMRQAGARDLHSCSVSFAQKSFDETKYIRLAAEYLQSEHHEMVFDVETFHRVLPELVERMDVPFADASLLPTYAVSSLARKYMKVVLSGDGADELLGGYGIFPAAEAAKAVGWLPSAVWGWLGAAASHLPVSHEYFSFDFKAKSFLRGMNFAGWQRNQVWLGSFTPQEMKKLLVAQAVDPFAAVDGLASEVKGLSLFDAVSLQFIRQYLQDDILAKLDRATMFHSLEARTPILDVDLAEFLFTLPAEYKKDKRILKEAMRGRIPDEIIDRPKKGFGIPLGQWFRGPLKGWLQATLSQERVERVGLWHWPYVRQMVKEHVEGRADHRKKLWTLCSYLLWHEEWVQTASQNSPRGA